jgi:hypothetical protein
MKPVNFASVLFMAAALGLWACQHSVPGEKVAAALAYGVAKSITR